MKRSRPSFMLLWPADAQSRALWGLYYDSSARCPRWCEYRGERHDPYWGHVEYVPKGLRHRPVPQQWRKR